MHAEKRRSRKIELVGVLEQLDYAHARMTSDDWDSEDSDEVTTEDTEDIETRIDELEIRIKGMESNSQAGTTGILGFLCPGHEHCSGAFLVSERQHPVVYASRRFQLG